MKILWITNTQTGDLPKLLGNKSVGGTWMDALIEDFISENKHELTVVTSSETEKAAEYWSRNVRYILLPGGYPMAYDGYSEKNINTWKRLFETVNPEVIHIWGTEFALGLAALKAAPEIPSVVYMQGILHAIARDYYAGMTEREVSRNYTFRDFIKKGGIRREKEDYLARSENETQTIKLSGNIICENKYCESEVRKFAPEINVYFSPLPINRSFFESRWKSADAKPRSVMTNASGYPLKGLHKLLEAIAIVKQKYPDVLLTVPGAVPVSDGSLEWLIRKRGYTAFLEKEIKRLNLKDNIVWAGSLGQDKLAKELASASVFVLASAVENHSSSLKEAMCVGVPSVASRVGGVPEYAIDGENALLYDYGDVKTQAALIMRLFEDKSLCEKISENARTTIRELHCESDIYRQTISIYEKVASHSEKAGVQ